MYLLFSMKASLMDVAKGFIIAVSVGLSIVKLFLLFSFFIVVG